MLTRHRRGGRDLPLRNKSNLQEQQLPTCRSPDTNLSSQARRRLLHSTHPDKYRAFLLKDSSDEETSCSEEKEQQADDELQKPPARRFIDVSKRTPSDDDDDDGDQQESSDERSKAASLEDSSSRDKRRELCSILVHDQKQSARPESAFASTKPVPQSKKRVRFDFDSCQEDPESECKSPSSNETNSPARGQGDESDIMDAPVPQSKRRVRPDCQEDLESECESPCSERNPPVRGGDESDVLTDDSAINLKCMKSIKRAYPKLLQPPWSYRTSIDKLKEFVNMTHPEKWAARTAFQKMSSATKQSFFFEIRGRLCTCCQQSQRKDKGVKRGPNKASRRRSKRVAGEMPSTNEVVCEYVSLAHSDARRSRQAKKQKVKNKWKHRRIKNLEHARNTQDQGSELSLTEVYNAVRATIRAATFSSQPPRVNTNGQLVYEQRKEIPRLRIGLFVVNEVQETPEYGGQLPADRLRRPKTQIHYVSSCPEDLQAILETITLAAGDNENYEKKKFFGTGEEAMRNLDDFMSKRKRKRARNITSKSLQDTQAGISMEDAPAI